MATSMLPTRVFSYARRISRTHPLRSIILPQEHLSHPQTCLVRISNDVSAVMLCASLHTTAGRCDLMEFFDDPKNWGEREVKSGRSWKKEEMRIKSNSDLHKLWFVLLKERNMLLTTQQECKRAVELFPSPERLDRIEESMSNLEEVVRERNRAYYELETGFTGERPTQMVEDVLGRSMFYRLREYPLPHFMNKKWQENYLFNYWDPAHVVDFKRRLREKDLARKDYLKIVQTRKAKGLIKRFPHVPDDALQDKFPDLDIGQIRRKLQYNEGIARN